MTNAWVLCEVDMKLNRGNELQNRDFLLSKSFQFANPIGGQVQNYGLYLSDLSLKYYVIEYAPTFP